MPTTWDPPMLATTARPGEEVRRHRVGRTIAATALTGLVAATIGLGRPVDGIGVAIVLGAVTIGVIVTASLRGTARGLATAGAIAFLPWLALRSSPWLLAPDVIAAGALVVLGTSCRNGAPARDSARGYRRRLLRAATGAASVPERVRTGVDAMARPWIRTWRQAAGPAVLGIALAVAVAAVLASGDALFASYLDPGDAAATATGRFLSALAAMTIVAAAGGAAVGSEHRPPIPSSPIASARALIVAATPLVAVYVAYVVVQCSTLILGADYVVGRTGLTFAEYARAGFFQLVAVSILTFVGLAIARPIARTAPPRGRRWVVTLAVVATASTAAMVVAAIVKLQLYAAEYGLTMLRLYTTVFAAWLGLALLISLVALCRPRGEWVVATIAATALLGVLAMNVVDPERQVAAYNLTVTVDEEDFDVDYLLGLSDDAIPTIADHLVELDPAERDRALARICRSGARSALDWNLARARVERIAAEAC